MIAIKNHLPTKEKKRYKRYLEDKVKTFQSLKEKLQQTGRFSVVQYIPIKADVQNHTS